MSTISAYVNDSIVSPGNTTRLSWYGGISTEDIYVYNIAYRSSSYASWNTFTRVDPDDSSCYVSPPRTRGNKYEYIVRAFDRYGYEIDSSNIVEVKANSLPDEPDVEVDRFGMWATFTATAGDDADWRDQNIVVKYTTSDSPYEFFTYTGPITISASSNITYNFYTYDGLEFSDAVSKTIEVKPKPQIYSVTYTSLSSYKAWGETGVSGYQYGYAYAVTPKISVNQTGTLKITAELEQWNHPSDPFSKDYEYNFADINLSSTSNVVLSPCNLHTAATAQVPEQFLRDRDIRWRLKFVLENEYEESDAVYWPANGYYYTIAKPPTLDAYYNRFEDSNVPGTNFNHVWRNVRMKFFNDESVPNVSVTATVGGNSLSSTSATTSVNGNYRYVNVTLPDNIPGNSSIVVTALLTDTPGYITKKVNCEVIESPAPNMGDITHGAEVIYPFTGTGNYQVSTRWPFGSYSVVDSTTLSAYNCSTTASDVIKFVHASDRSGTNQVVKTLTWAKSGDNFEVTMDRATAYGWSHELGYATYAGRQTYYCQLQITNLFKKTFTSNWLIRYFDFNELAQDLEFSTVEWAQTNTTSTSWNPFTIGEEGDAVQETLYLRFGLTFGLFTKDKITVNLRLTNDAGTNTVLTKDFQASELTRATGRTAVSNTVHFIYGPVSNISTSNNRKWTFKVTTTRGTTDPSPEITMRAQRQTAPNTNFLACSTTQDYNLAYQFTQTDTGGGTVENFLYGGGSDLSNEIDIGSGIVQSLVTGWDVKSICIKSVSTVTGLITRTVEYYSNYIIVYQLSPTVAYRKNQLGINTNSPASGAAVDIHQSTGANSILFQGLDTNGNAVKFDMNILNGTIKFYINDVVQHTLDMVNGTLT